MSQQAGASVSIDISQALSALKQLGAQFQQTVQQNLAAANAGGKGSVQNTSSAMKTANAGALQLLKSEGRLVEQQVRNAASMRYLEARTAAMGSGFRKAAGHAHGYGTALDKIGSAASGVMLGQGLLNRSLMQVGFGLIFLKFSMVPLVALFATLTVAAGIFGKTLSSLAFGGRAAAAEMESWVQRMASFTGSVDLAAGMERQAENVAEQFGIVIDSARKMEEELVRAGIASDTYRKAMLNTAAASGKVPEEVAADFRNLLKNDGQSKDALIRKFAEDYNVNVKNFSSSLELAKALNEQYAGAATNAAMTQQGAINRLAATWQNFQIMAGTIVGEAFKILIEPVISFVKAMKSGFSAMFEADKASGKLGKTMDGLRGSAVRLTPILEKIGYVIGKVMYQSIMFGIKAVKTLIDVFISIWQRLKPVVDMIMAFVKWLKETIDKILAWNSENDNLLGKLALVYAALWGLSLIKPIAGGIFEALAGLGKIATKPIRDLIQQLRALAGILPGVGGQQQAPNTTQQPTTTVKPKWKFDMGDFSSALGGLIGGAISGIIGSMGFSVSIGTLVRAIPLIMRGLMATAGVGPIIQGFLTMIQGAVVGAASAIAAVGWWVALIAAIVAILGGILIAPEWTGKLAGKLAAFLVIGLFMAAEMIGEGVQAVVAGIVKGFNYFIEGDFFKDIGKVWTTLKDISIGDIAGFFADILRSLGTGFTGVVSFIGKRLGKFKDAFVDSFRDTLKEWGYWDDWTGFIGGIHRALESMMVPWLLFWSIFIEPIYEFGKKAVTWVAEHVGKWGSNDGFIGAIYTAFNALLTGIMFFENPFGSILNWATIAYGWIKDKLGNWNEYTGALGLAHTGFNSIKNGIEAFGNFFSPIMGWVDTIFSKIFDIFGMGTTGIGYIITQSIEGVRGFLSTVANPFETIANWIGNALRWGDTTFNWFLGKWQWLMDHLTLNMSVNVSIPGKSALQGFLEGGWIPGRQFGGIVPGRVGQKQLILAEAGEMFMGDPRMGGRSPRAMSMMGGGTTVNVPIYVSNSVVTNREAMSALAEEITGQIYGRLRITSRMSLHRG